MTKALYCFLLLITGDGKNARSYSPETFVLSLSLFLSFALRHCAHTQCIIPTFRLSLSRFFLLFFPPLSSSRTYCLFYVHPPVKQKRNLSSLFTRCWNFQHFSSSESFPPSLPLIYTTSHSRRAKHKTQDPNTFLFRKRSSLHSEASSPTHRIAASRRAAPYTRFVPPSTIFRVSSAAQSL